MAKQIFVNLPVKDLDVDGHIWQLIAMEPGVLPAGQPS